MSELLKPCPFCGSDDVHFASHPTTARWGVICDTCDVWRDDRCATKGEAATIWNTRADLSDALLREAMGAFENAMGHLDTPISRRKIGIDPNAEWLLDARATLAKLRAHLEEPE